LRKSRSPADYAEAFGEEISAKPEEKTEKENWYIGFARKAGTMFKTENKFTKEEYGAALDFLGWDLQPREVNAAPMLALALGLVVTVIGFGYMYYMISAGDLAFSLEDISTLMPVVYPSMGLLLLPFVLIYYFQSYPLRAANDEKMKSIASIPEIVNYMIMSMKLTSNLEKAVEFAGDHGKGKIATDLRDLSWHIQIGSYRTIEEGLDELAYKWGRYSEEFKHALMLIRSSVIEVDEAKRAIILDKAMSDVLEGIKDDMDKYAAQMRQPSVYLYYIGVLLPLMLIIMLPIGSVMAKLPLAQTWVLVLLYNIAIPIGAVLFAQNILKNRPPLYTPPTIPDTHPGLPKKGNMLLGGTEVSVAFLAIIAAVGVFMLFYFVVDPFLNPYPLTYQEEKLASYYPFFKIAGSVIAVCIGISVYLYGISIAKRKAQKDIMAMELEFQDSIYVLASRLGENRPIEEAVAYVSDFLPNSKIAPVFSKTSDNITNLGMTIEMALFDPIYGALKDVPSDLIRGSMKIVIDSINLGVQQGARALISLSMQLRDSQKIKDKIASLLEEITSMMKSIAFLIAPLVLGITVALQKIIINALKSSLATEAQAGSIAGAGIPQISLGDPAMLSTIPGPEVFLLILAIFVIEITLILIYFTSKIEEGDNDLAVKMNIATSLPIAIILFFMAAWFTTGLSIGG
jgi:hypothetical protein